MGRTVTAKDRLIKPILTTIHAPGVRFWREQSELLDREALSRTGLVRRIVAAAPHHRALVLKGSVAFRHGYSDLVGAGLAGRRTRGPIVLDDCEWEMGSAALRQLTGRVIPRSAPARDDVGFARLARAAIRAIDSPRTIYCVLSTEELELFPQTWGIDPARVAFVPWHVSASDSEIEAPVTHDGPVFAGGDSMRDYGVLLEAARTLPNVEFTIASGGLDETLLPNVTAGLVPHVRFMELLRNASVVVVPLAHSEFRSAGQQTYLNAMAMGKTVIVTDALGVRDHVDAGRDALVVPTGDSDALSCALAWALDPANGEAIVALRQRARHVRSRFTFEHHLRCLDTVVQANL